MPDYSTSALTLYFRQSKFNNMWHLPSGSDSLREKQRGEALMMEEYVWRYTSIMFL